MNQLDVQVLTSFTRKLAYAAEKMAAPDMSGLNAFLSGAASQAGEVGRAAMDFGRAPKPSAEAKPMVPNVTKPPKPFSAPPVTSPEAPTGGVDLGPDIKLPSGKEAPATFNPRTRERNPSLDEIVDTLGEPQELPPAASGQSYTDMLMGALPYAGGAAAGGLGAMALARLFNSSKDDEEESSWAPWLAGLGGAAAGAGAVHYSPQLLEMVNALRGGNSPAPAAAPPAAAQA